MKLCERRPAPPRCGRPSAVSSPLHLYLGALLGSPSQPLAWPVALWVPCRGHGVSWAGTLPSYLQGLGTASGRLYGVSGTMGSAGV